MSENNIDFDGIRAQNPIAEVIGRNVKLTRQGHEWIGLCPFHDEKTSSFTVYKDRFHCFGCAADGDVIDYVAQSMGCSTVQAVQHLTGNMPVTHQAKASKAAPEQDFVESAPPPDAPEPEFAGASHVYVYRTAGGEIARYILRWDTPSGKKIGARTWGTLKGVTFWHPKQSANRGLYGLELLSMRPDAPILVVEGEKAADAARPMFPGWIVVTWSGGSEAVRKTDWEPIKGRRIVIWPDNDTPGYKAAAVVRGIVGGEILDVSDLPESADAADIERPNDPDQWIFDRLPAPDLPPDEIPPGDFPEEAPEAAGTPSEGVIPLGHDHGVFYYFSKSSRQVWALSSAQHVQATYSGMASVAHYWSRLPQHLNEKGGINWNSVTDWLQTECRHIGIYDPRRMRGRGAWMDDGRTIVHLGDRLIVNGQQTPVEGAESRYIYEAGARLVHALPDPARTEEAHWLFKISKILRWERKSDATLFAGWLALAPICGALEWRPSLFLTGASGSGKTWIVSNIIVPVLNGFALHVGASTTEAFLRQSLGSDALPVIFDEAEREGAKAASAMQEVMHLVRQSSSEGGGVIGKGGQAGKPTSYRIRSMFCFQAINVGMTNRADETRISVVSLRSTSSETDVSFPDLQVTVAERLTPEVCARVIARSISLIPVIRHNAEVFAAEIERKKGSRRLGDQLGALYAGAYSLHSSNRITPEAAQDYLTRNLGNDTQEEPEKDEIRLLQRLLETKIRVGSIEIPIQILIFRAFLDGQDTSAQRDEATRELAAIGIRAMKKDGREGIAVAISHSQLARILQGTPWDSAWGRSLARIDGALSGRDFKPVRMGTYGLVRAVWVPLPEIVEESA